MINNNNDLVENLLQAAVECEKFGMEARKTGFNEAASNAEAHAVMYLRAAIHRESIWKRGCKDDSCDAIHCPRCGGHKIGWYTEGICSSCEMEME